MKTIINLDPNFTPFGAGIKFSKFNFPSGVEPHVKLPLTLIGEDDVTITCRPHTGNDILEILLTADALIAFWDGKSKGTSHMISVAKKKGLQVTVINY